MNKSTNSYRAAFSDISSKQDKILIIARSMLLYTVLFKYSGIRIWPHVYAGEAFSPSRVQYYLEASVTLFALIMLIMHGTSLKSILRAEWPSVTFSLIAIVSSLVVSASNPGSTFYALGYLDILTALSLSLFFDGSKVAIRIVLNSAFLFLCLNAVSLLVPARSFMIGEFSGAFRGLTAHRNDLSQVSAVYLLVSLFAGSVRKTQRVANVVLAILMVALARSAQGIVLTMFGVAMLPFLRLPTKTRRFAFVILIAVVSVFLFLLVFIPDDVADFFAFFGRDTSFTGRDRIWALSLYLISAMPFSGYGTGFMTSDNISVGLLAEYQLGTLFSSAHNAYLEAILTYGWVGSAPFFYIVLRAARRLIDIIWSLRDSGLYLAAVLFMYCLVGGLTASEKLFLPSFGWLSFFFAMALYDARIREAALVREARKAIRKHGSSLPGRISTSGSPNESKEQPILG